MPNLTLVVPDFGKNKPKIAVCKAIKKKPCWSILYNSKGQSKGEVILFFEKNSHLVIRTRLKGFLPWEKDLGKVSKDSIVLINNLVKDMLYKDM